MARGKKKPLTGYTLDTGVLIALERRKRGVAEVLREAVSAGLALHISSAVVAEFWRGSPHRELESLVRRYTVPDSLERAIRAGRALAAVTGSSKRGRGPGVVDALVAALAHETGTTVMTSDPDDLALLASHFAGLEVLAV